MDGLFMHVSRYDYWRNLFPRVTEEAILNFKADYQGSEEEKGDVLRCECDSGIRGTDFFSIRQHNHKSGQVMSLSASAHEARACAERGVCVCVYVWAVYEEFKGKMADIIDNVMLATDGRLTSHLILFLRGDPVEGLSRFSLFPLLSSNLSQPPSNV
jgi:hypothetical protein